jgi:hypothetical protein
MMTLMKDLSKRFGKGRVGSGFRSRRGLHEECESQQTGRIQRKKFGYIWLQYRFVVSH